MREWKLFSISEENMPKKKCVHGRIVLLTFYSKWAKSKKCQASNSLNTVSSVVWKSKSFDRWVSLETNFLKVGFFPDWHLLKLFSFSDWHLLKFFFFFFFFFFFRLESVKVVFCSPVCWASSKLTVEAEINHYPWMRFLYQRIWSLKTFQNIRRNWCSSRSPDQETDALLSMSWESRPS